MATVASTHPTTLKYVGRIVFSLLLAFFIWRVVESGEDLFSYDVVTSVSKQYSKLRLHPSLSICVGLKNVTIQALLEDIDGTLQSLLQDVLMALVHHNGSDVR